MEKFQRLEFGDLGMGSWSATGSRSYHVDELLGIICEVGRSEVQDQVFQFREDTHLTIVVVGKGRQKRIPGHGWKIETDIDDAELLEVREELPNLQQIRVI